MPRGDLIQYRRGTKTEWLAVNPILASGEIGYNSTDNEIRVGDGLRAWSDLAPIASGDGSDGKSAYEIAVQNGYIGTEAQWLASLVGDPATNIITSVNGKTGAVSLTAADVGALSTTTTAVDLGAATTAQGAKADTAVQPAALNGYVPTSRTVAGSALNTNIPKAALGVLGIPLGIRIPNGGSTAGIPADTWIVEEGPA